jgi:hypothetical protein
MRVYQILLKNLAATLLSALLLGIVFVIIGSPRTNTAAAPVFSAKGMVGVRPAAPASPGEMNALNPNPPSGTVKLVFIHHSCGENWLDDWSGGLGTALGNNNYFVSDSNYGWGPPDADLGYGTIGDHTDIGHWYNWFVGSHRDTYLNALYALSDRNSGYPRWLTDPGGENEIIMFKSCYPNSNLKGDPDDPPTVGSNPLRGEGSWSDHHTVGNAKGIYNDILEFFRTRQDKLFVVITAPPVQDETYAANARAFNNWLVNDWLADYPYHNVAVFDFFNVLTTNGGDPDTNDYGWSTGNHHRVVTTTIPVTIEHTTNGDDDASPGILEYPTNGDDHPNPVGNQKATGEFVPLLNVYYNCWKHGECREDATAWISVTAATGVASVCPGETATYTLSVTASEDFTTPVALTLQGAPSEATVSFDPDPITPPGTSQLHITTITSTVAGIYTMTVTGTAGVLTDTASLFLIVTSATPSFTLSVSPTTCIARPNQIVSYTAVVTGVNGFSQPVTLTVLGLPPGVGASWSVNPVTPGNSSILTLSIPSSPPFGDHPLQVVGTAETQTVAKSVRLIIDYPFKSYLPIILK